MSKSPKPDEHFVLCADCKVPLVFTFAVDFKEYVCPVCHEYTEFYDRHDYAKWEAIPADKQQIWLDRSEDREKWEPGLIRRNREATSPGAVSAVSCEESASPEGGESR